MKKRKMGHFKREALINLVLPLIILLSGILAAIIIPFLLGHYKSKTLRGDFGQAFSRGCQVARVQDMGTSLNV